MMQNDRDARIDALLLHNELHEVICRYFDMTDNRRFHETPDFFTADGQFNLYLSRADFQADNPVMSYRGATQVQGMATSALAYIDQTHHTISNFRVEHDGGRVIAHGNMRNYHRGYGITEGKDEESLAAFRAHMEQENGRWKIARLDEIMYIMLGTLDAFPEMSQLKD
jgi:3-phenylpropionate/cinnamic acid dioxygenase small subunit